MHSCNIAVKCCLNRSVLTHAVGSLQDKEGTDLAEQVDQRPDGCSACPVQLLSKGYKAMK